MNTQITPALTKEEINVLHSQFQTYGRNAKEWIRKCQLLLPRIRDEEVWKKKGFASIYEYAAKLAGMSHNSVNEALRILEKTDGKPLLYAAIEKYGINRVKPVIAIATEETQKFWVKKIDKMAQKTLEVYVREYRHSGLAEDLNAEKNDGLRAESQRVESQDEDMSNEGANESQTCKIAMYMKLEVEVIEKLKQIKGDRDWNELMKDLLEGQFENIGDGGLSKSKGVAEKSENVEIEKPAPVNTGKRYIPAKIRKHVIKQTSGLCAYPGCGKPYDILHHTKRFALDKTHGPNTLKPLCKAHERLAHGGLIGNEDAEPVNWALRTEADESESKYVVDKKANKYYVPRPWQ